MQGCSSEVKIKKLSFSKPIYVERKSETQVYGIIIRAAAQVGVSGVVVRGTNRELSRAVEKDGTGEGQHKVGLVISLSCKKGGDLLDFLGDLLGGGGFLLSHVEM